MRDTITDGYPADVRTHTTFKQDLLPSISKLHPHVAFCLLSPLLHLLQDFFRSLFFILTHVFFLSFVIKPNLSIEFETHFQFIFGPSEPTR